MLIALLSVIVLWSEIHSAFYFFRQNISLWDVTSTVQGVESLEPVTLGAVLIAILVFIITTQLARANLPALLELATAVPGFNAGYGLRYHHHHQISADADWRAGRLLNDWY